jgi:hypothetical protein
MKFQGSQLKIPIVCDESPKPTCLHIAMKFKGFQINCILKGQNSKTPNWFVKYKEAPRLPQCQGSQFQAMKLQHSQYFVDCDEAQRPLS